MKNKSVLRRVGKVLLVILIVIVLVLASAVAVFEFYLKPKYASKVVTELQSFLDDSDMNAAIDPAMVGDLQAAIGTEAPAQQATVADTSAAPTTEVQATQSSGEAAQPEATQAAGTSPSDTSTVGTPAAPKEGAVPGDAVQPAQSPEAQKQEKLSASEVIGKMDGTDRKRVTALIAKLDIGYLSKLASGGMTPEEKEQAKEHIKSRLSASEYAELKTLGGKYMHFLQ